MKAKTKIMNEKLKEADEIISYLSAYGSIHTVEGVSYPAGTHREFITKAQNWLNRYRNNL